MPDALKALSIRQPWAWLIVHGYKDIENRSWPTRFRGSVLIHAGKRFDQNFDDAEDWAWYGVEKPDHLDFGGIVGEALIVDCVSAYSSQWFTGPYGFVLREEHPLPFRPCRGLLGFFTPDFTQAEAVVRAKLGAEQRARS